MRFSTYEAVVAEVYGQHFLAMYGARHARLGILNQGYPKALMWMMRYQGDVVIYVSANLTLSALKEETDVSQIEGGVVYCLRHMRNLTTSEALEAAERRRCVRRG